MLFGAGFYLAVCLVGFLGQAVALLHVDLDIAVRRMVRDLGRIDVYRVILRQSTCQSEEICKMGNCRPSKLYRKVGVTWTHLYQGVTDIIVTCVALFFFKENIIHI